MEYLAARGLASAIHQSLLILDGGEMQATSLSLSSCNFLSYSSKCNFLKKLSVLASFTDLDKLSFIAP